jgi:anthranilate/para-aminobenzoate synthase component I
VAIDHQSGRVFVVGDSAQTAAALRNALAGGAPRPEAPPPVAIVEPEDPARHGDRIRAALELIRRGDLYQVNLARALDVRLGAAPSVPAQLTLYRRLVTAAPTPLASFLVLGEATVLSTSPELLVLAEAPGGPEIGAAATAFGSIFTAPIKGTRPRGRDALEDAALAKGLDQDPKERAELAMILDVERNDLGRVAVPGSVRLLDGPSVTRHPTVHHREALLGARVRAGVTRNEVFGAMLPSGSVTGAPKVRAMEVIADLEPRRRGLYTGGIGHVAQDGGLHLAMAIRTLVLADDGGEYLSGGGIVADSDPDRETEETRWKAVQLQRVVTM